MITDDGLFIQKISFKEIEMVTGETMYVSNHKCPRQCRHLRTSWLLRS